MAGNSVPIGSAKLTFGVGETLGTGLFGEQVSVTYNQQTGEPQLNAQLTGLGIAGKFSETESGVTTYALGVGNIVGAGAGTSSFLGVQYNSENGFGVQASFGATGANGAAVNGNAALNFESNPNAWTVDGAGETNGANYSTGFELPQGSGSSDANTGANGFDTNYAGYNSYNQPTDTSGTFGDANYSDTGAAAGNNTDFSSYSSGGTSDGSVFSSGAPAYNDYSLGGSSSGASAGPDQSASSGGGGSVFDTGTAGYNSYGQSTQQDNTYTPPQDMSGSSYYGNDYTGSSSSGGYSGGYSGGNWGGYSGGYGYAPVILDIAGKGINIAKLGSSNTFEDMTGDGYKNRTAWAGIGNGVLFVDTTGAGQLTQANQIIFTKWDPGAKSDMQALLDVFDTNHDGALDSGDTDFSKFFVMVTNADGTQTASSLAALGISSINLNANATHVALPDGSSIDGQTTFTMTNPSTGVTTTNTAATVTLAVDANGYLVATTTAANADGSKTVANVASNADGSVAYESILNTSANGLSRTLTHLNNGGVVTTIQTDNTAINGDGSKTETLTNYLGGAIQANGELTAAGTSGSAKLNATTTTTSANGKVVTILRDQLGGGWTTQREVDTTNADASRSIMVSNLNPDGSVSNVTTTALSADGLARTVTSLVDGIAADSTAQSDVTVVNGATRTETMTGSAGTTVTSKLTTVTQTAASSLTRTTTSDLTDGTTLDLTSVAQTVTNADGSSTTTLTDTAADGTLRDETVTQLSASGLLKTTSIDQTGATLGGAPVFDTTITDDTVVDADGSRTQTVTQTSADNTQLSQSVTVRAASSAGRTVTVHGNGDGAVTQSETVTVNATTGTTSATLSNLNADGSLINQVVTATSANGLSRTTQLDSTGAVSGGAAVFDHTTTDVTTTSGGTSTETVTDYGATTSNLIDVTKTTVSANGLTRTVSRDFTGAGGIADGSWDKISVDQTVVNADGSLTETVTMSDGASHLLNQTIQATSADRRTVTTTSTKGTSGLVKQVETMATQSNGAVVDTVVNFDKNGDVLNAAVSTTSADGLTKTVQSDVQGQTAAAYATGGLAFDSTTTATIVINADGSRSNTTNVTSRNGTLVATSSTAASANGLSITTTANPFATAHYASQTLNTTTLNADGSVTNAVLDYNYSGSLTDQTWTTISAQGLSKTVLHDFDGDGVTDQSTTDFATINADGSRTEVVTDYDGGGTVRDVTTATSGIIVAGAGLETTISRQSNGSVPTYTVETILPSADGTVTDTTQYYSENGGPLLKTVIASTSANGLTRVVSTELNGDATADFWTTDTTVLNADGSRTETIANYNQAGLFSESVTTVSANGFSKTTSVDADGFLNASGGPDFNLVTTDNSVLNTANGSLTETVTNKASDGSTLSQTVTTTSADQQTINITSYLDESGTITNIDRATTIQTQADGSVVRTSQSYDYANALLGTVTTTASGNGLSKTTTYKNATGTTVDTQSSITTYDANGDGGTLNDFEDFDVVNGTTLHSSVKTQASANGQTQATTTVLTGALASTIPTNFTVVTNASLSIADNGETTQTVTDTINAAASPSDTTITVTAANQRQKTTWTMLGSASSAAIYQQQTTALDGSTSQTVAYYDPATLSVVLDQTTVDTSFDGRTITSDRWSDYDLLNQSIVNNPSRDAGNPGTYTPAFSGSGWNHETATYVKNADGSTYESRQGSGSFGATAYVRYDTVVTNADSSVTTDTRYGDAVGILTGEAISEVSADGLIKAQAFDPTARDTPENLTAAAAALVNGTALPSSLLTTDIISLDTTTLNADGTRTEWIQTGFGSIANVRSQTQTTTSANGLTTTSWTDNDGNGVYEQYSSTNVAADGSTTTVYGYYGNTAATNTLQGQNNYSTSANGLVSTLTTSTGLTDTIVRLANANGSYQFSQTVVAGSVAATVNGELAGSSSHSIDANGIDTWTSTSSYGPSTVTVTTTIDIATERREIAAANEIAVTLLGHPMDNEEREFLNLYITNGVFNREQLAYDLVSNSLEYENNYAVSMTYNGQVHRSYDGFDIYAAFENALGRLPTAEELGTFGQYLAGPNVTFDNLAAMAVAVAQYAMDQGSVNNRTPADPNATLLSTAPSWISPASNAIQIQTAGTYSYSGTFITDLNATTSQGVTAAINGNSDVILAGNNSNLTVSGFNNSIDDLWGSATITASNAAILIEPGCIGTVSGDNDQIAQLGLTQLTLSSGVGDVIFIAPAAAPSPQLPYTLAYSTTNASYAVITMGAGVGTAANPARINGDYNAVSASGNDFFTVTGTGNTIAVNGGGDTFTSSGSAISIVDGVTGVTINGTGNTVTLGVGSSVQLTGSGDSIMLSGNDTATVLANTAISATGSNNVVTVSDTAANVAANLAALNGNPNVSVITLTGTGTQTLALTAAQVAADTIALGKISNASYNITVSDSSSNVVANIAALNANTHLRSVTLTGTGTPTLALTAAQLAANTTVLSKISNTTYSITVSDTAAHVAANIAALNANTHLTSITLTGTGTQTLALTAAQVATGTVALSKISNATYNITVSDTAANVAANIAALNANSHLTAITLTGTGPQTLTLTTAQFNADTVALGKITNASYIVNKTATDGSNTLIAHGSGDTLVGGSGSTTLVSNAAGNTLRAGTGTTVASYANSSLTVNLATGRASVNGSSTSDTLTGINNVVVSGNSATVIGGSGTQKLTASGTADTLTAGTGTSTLTNTGSSGFYDYNTGAGQAIIVNGASTNASASNELDFGSGITDNKLWFEHVGNDLQIDLMGAANKVDIAGWFSSAGNQLQEITAGGLKLDSQVSQLVQAMATYSANHTGFNPSVATQAPNDPALQSAIASSWHA
jgi:hypothetical protein